MVSLRDLYKSHSATPFFALFSLIFSLYFTSPVFAEEWSQEKGDHFIIYYIGNDAFAKELKYKAEIYYIRVANDLGYARYSNFWQWDDRAKIYIHPTKEAFQKATGQPAWSHGAASYFNKELHFIQGTEGLADTILPHEITHLIFRDFVGFKGQIPLWMDEGVAQWEEADKRREALQVMPHLLQTGQAYLVERLMHADIRQESDPKRVDIFYLQSISMIDFMIKTYGATSFTNFCRELRDGKSLDEALQTAYSYSMPNIGELEKKWRQHVWSTQNLQESA